MRVREVKVPNIYAKIKSRKELVPRRNGLREELVSAKNWASQTIDPREELVLTQNKHLKELLPFQHVTPPGVANIQGKWYKKFGTFTSHYSVLFAFGNYPITSHNSVLFAFGISTSTKLKLKLGNEVVVVSVCPFQKYGATVKSVKFCTIAGPRIPGVLWVPKVKYSYWCL